MLVRMAEINLAFVSAHSAETLATEIQRLVHSRELVSGERLPPVRSVARQVGLSPATVGQAWKLLAQHGVIETRGRAGTFIARTETPQPWRQFRNVSGVQLAHDLSTGFPDPELLPDLADHLSAAARAGRFRGYDSARISTDLLAGLKDEVIAPLTGDVLLATHVLGLLAEVLPVIGGFRTPIAVGDPEFAPYLDLIERAGMTAAPFGYDDDGPRVDDVQRVLAGGAAAVILQPRVHNPTGRVTTEHRLREIALLCASRDVAIIEVDYFGGLSSSPRMSAAHWAPDQTLHIRSFSKDFHPDIRVVVAAGAPRILRPVVRRRVGGFDVGSVNQELLRLLVSSPEARATRDRAKVEYDRRRSTVVAELGRSGIDVLSRDGLNLWVPVRSEQDALVHLAHHGISAAPGSAFQVSDRRQPHLRVSVAAMGGVTVELAHSVAAAAGAYRVKN